MLALSLLISVAVAGSAVDAKEPVRTFPVAVESYAAQQQRIKFVPSSDGFLAAEPSTIFNFEGAGLQSFENPGGLASGHNDTPIDHVVGSNSTTVLKNRVENDEPVDQNFCLDPFDSLCYNWDPLAIESGTVVTQFRLTEWALGDQITAWLGLQRPTPNSNEIVTNIDKWDGVARDVFKQCAAGKLSELPDGLAAVSSEALLVKLEVKPAPSTGPFTATATWTQGPQVLWLKRGRPFPNMNDAERELLFMPGPSPAAIKGGFIKLVEDLSDEPEAIADLPVFLSADDAKILLEKLGLLDIVPKLLSEGTVKDLLFVESSKWLQQLQTVVEERTNLPQFLKTQADLVYLKSGPEGCKNLVLDNMGWIVGKWLGDNITPVNKVQERTGEMVRAVMQVRASRDPLPIWSKDKLDETIYRLRHIQINMGAPPQLHYDETAHEYFTDRYGTIDSLLQSQSAFEVLQNIKNHRISKWLPKLMTNKDPSEEWPAAHRVNAFYSYESNQIWIPVAMYWHPFADALSTLIAHEMAHALPFFELPASCNSFGVKSPKIDELVADIIGVQAAIELGLNGNQTTEYTNYAKIWCAGYPSDEARTQWLAEDEHLVEPERVSSILKYIKGVWSAFHCTDGAPNVGDDCLLW